MMPLDLSSVELEINYEVGKILKELHLDNMGDEEENEMYKMLVYNVFKKGYMLRMEHEVLMNYTQPGICTGDVEL